MTTTGSSSKRGMIFGFALKTRSLDGLIPDVQVVDLLYVADLTEWIMSKKL